MLNWLDLCVIGFITLRTLGGYHIGFIKSFFNAAGFVIAVIAARLFHPLVSSLIMATALGEKIRSGIYTKVLEIIEGALSSGQITTPEVGAVTDLLNLPTFLKNSIISNSATAVAINVGKHSIAEHITHSLATLAVTAISVVVIFFGVRIGVTIAATTLNSVASLPLLKQINKTGGVVFGFAMSIISIMILFAVLTPFLSFQGTVGFRSAIEGSTLARYIYYNNFVLQWLVNVAFKALTA